MHNPLVLEELVNRLTEQRALNRNAVIGVRVMHEETRIEAIGEVTDIEFNSEGYKVVLHAKEV